MIKKEITYKDFKIEYATEGEVPCQYINVIDQSLTNKVVNINMIINLLNSNIEVEIKNLDIINNEVNKLYNNINKISNVKQAYNIAKIFSKKFYEYVKSYQSYNQINSIKVIAINNFNLNEISELIEKIEEHKQLFKKSIDYGLDIYKSIFKGTSKIYDTLTPQKRIEMLKILNPIISKSIDSKKKTLNESNELLLNEEFNIFTLVGDTISYIINGVTTGFEYISKFFSGLKSVGEGIFYTGIGITFIFVLTAIFSDAGRSAFIATVITIIQTLLTFPPVKIIFVVAGMAFAIMFIALMIFLTITVCKYIKNVYIDMENEEAKDDLNVKLDLANQRSKQKNNIQKNTSVTSMFSKKETMDNNNVNMINNNDTTNNNSSDPTTISFPSSIGSSSSDDELPIINTTTNKPKFNFTNKPSSTTNNNNNNTSVNDLPFSGFNNTAGFRPPIQSKPNDKYGIF